MSLIARQAIIYPNYSIMGYDILFRDEEPLADNSNISISASVLEQILGQFGLENILGGYLGFLKIDIEFLKSDMVANISKDNFVLMILESSLYHPELESILSLLYAKGYRFGINSCMLDIKIVKRIKELSPWIDYIRIDTLLSPLETDEFIEDIKAMNKKIIAFKIETDEIFKKYKSYDIDYFQGYFIKRPHTIENESLSTSQETIMRVWKLLQTDAEIAEIVAILEQDHALMLKLLQFINSSYFLFSLPITSVRQVISLVGRKALSNWLLLMLASHKSHTPLNHPLLLMVINRTEIMMGLLKLSSPKCSKAELDTAYLVGMLSIIHLLLNMNHREFLRKLNVSPEIEEAMFEAQGRWGQLLVVTRHIENMDSNSIKPFIERHNVDTNQLNLLIANAMEKVNAFNEMLQNNFL